MPLLGRPLSVLLLLQLTVSGLQLGEFTLARKCKGHLPPVGAVYKRELALPVLGHQVLELSIINSTTAMLQMQGAINMKEPVLYRDDGKGRLDFTLNAATIRMLRRVRTSLRDAEYDTGSDSAIVTVAPPVIPAIRIRLHRTPPRLDDEEGSGDKLDKVESHMAIHAALS
jgi:hypothetical protein